jgi:RNA polymerase sigma factor (sigma-70 family)
MMHSDDQLVEGCRKGDRTAQKNLYEKYSRRMFGVCLRYCDSNEDAEEVLQEGLLKVFQKINDYKGQGSLEGWIRKIMINASLDLYRRNKNRKNEMEWQENISISVEPLEALNAKELLKVIMQLPKGFRTVFNLYAIEGYNHAEIGKMLSISEGTSKSQYARARSHLAKQLENEKKSEIKQIKDSGIENGIVPVL